MGVDGYSLGRAFQHMMIALFIVGLALGGVVVWIGLWLWDHLSISFGWR